MKFSKRTSAAAAMAEAHGFRPNRFTWLIVGTCTYCRPSTASIAALASDFADAFFRCRRQAFVQ